MHIVAYLQHCLSGLSYQHEMLFWRMKSAGTGKLCGMLSLFLHQIQNKKGRGSPRPSYHRLS